MSNYHETYEQFLSLSNLQLKPYTDSEQELKKSMKRMEAFLVHLGSPHEKIDFIHVAGTSGKGSTTHLIHEILHEDGQVVGSYLSPHTTSYLERFYLNDELIDPTNLTKFMQTVMQEYQKFLQNKEPLSFFELSTALAIYAFQKSGVDWCVLETGMGGKWDATNVIKKPVVGVITNIDKDHTHILGDSLSAIACKKAGIMKKGSIVICGEMRSSLRRIFKEEAISKQAALFFVPPPTTNKINQDLGIKHQHNAAIAERVALEVGVKKEVIARAFKKHRELPCRFETIQHNPTIILDGAHSPAKMQATVDRITKLGKPVHVVLGSVATKDIEAELKILAPIAKTITTTRFTHGFRKATNPAKLLSLVPKRERAGYTLNPFEALQHAESLVKKDEIILVTGSLYLAGELRSRWFPEKSILKNKSSF